MKYINWILSADEISELQKEFGSYTKVTVDLLGRQLVIGCELHADGEEILLEKGALSVNIWGGGVNFDTKKFDCTAVLNLRASLGNDSMEIIDPERRVQFLSVLEEFFQNI